MSLTAVLHGYPPFWSMGGEISTHRTIRYVPGSTAITNALYAYELDGVQVRPWSDDLLHDIQSVGASVLYAHSAMSAETVSAALKLGLPSILAVHAPPRFATDLRRAWGRATVRLYNTEAARRAWNDPRGLVLHPPIDRPTLTDLAGAVGRRDALTLTSSLKNKGAHTVLRLAASMPDRRFIIVESPAHSTHGSPSFWDEAGALPNVEVWSRLDSKDMYRLWAETHILLVPSRYETYGMSALEAAWYGIPSIHIDTPDVREGIGTGAWLLDKGTPDNVAAGITSVENNYDRWSQRARRRAEEVYERGVGELDEFAACVAAMQAPQPTAP